MPSPSSTLTTLRPDLAGSLMEFDLAMDRNGFIAMRVAPVMEVGQQAGVFGKVPIEQLLQLKDTARAPGSGYNRGKFTFTDDSYACKENGWEEPVDDREAKMYANYFDAELIATQRAYDFVLRNQEIRMAALLFNTSTWTGATLTTAASIPWSTVATATPVTDVEAAVRKVWTNSGRWPNTLVLERRKFRDLRLCDQIIDRIRSAGAGNPTKASDITAEMLAQVFDLEQVIVAGSAKNTANPGQTAAVGSCWDTTMAMVCYVDSSKDIRRPTIARTFHWSDDGSEIGGAVETYRDETVRSDITRVRHDTMEKVMYVEMGHLLTSL